MLQPLYPGWESASYLLNRLLGGPLPRIEPQTHRRPDPNQSLHELRSPTSDNSNINTNTTNNNNNNKQERYQ
jgi:hypothetical protein